MTDRTLEQVRADIEVAREEALSSLDLVRQELVELVDWRVHYRRHCWRWLGVAAGLGFFIGFQSQK
jgi:hypothetical protein